MSKKEKEELPDLKFFSKEIDRIYKNGTVKIIDAKELEDPEPNSTGSFSLDYDLAVPFPEGGVIEIFGDEGSYKTTLMYQAVAEALEKGKQALIINAERSLNRRHAEGIRKLRKFVSKDSKESARLSLATTMSGEEALNTMRIFASNFPRSVIALDSVDAALPEAVISGQIGENKIGNHSKLMSDALRKLIGIAHDNKVTLIFINQMRSKITSYGDPNDTSGGRALKYYAHQRIKLLKPGKAQIMTDADGDAVGVYLRYRVEKNKFNPHGDEGEIPLLYGYGFYDAEEIISLCLKFGLLEFGGRGGKQVVMNKPIVNDDGLFTGEFEDETRVFTKAKAAILLKNDPKLFEYYRDQLVELLKPVSLEEQYNGISDPEE